MQYYMIKQFYGISKKYIMLKYKYNYQHTCSLHLQIWVELGMNLSYKHTSFGYYINDLVMFALL